MPRISEQEAGQRLDAFLRAWQPELSLRAARRLATTGLARVNGKAALPGRKLACGDIVSLAENKDAEKGTQPALLTVGENYCCFFKPAFLHTASLAGSDAPSLESWLPALTASLQLAPVLLQRLDHATRGLVCAALDENAKKAFRAAEKSGQCEKFYYALLEGRLEKAANIKKAIATENRKKCRVLNEDGDRATLIEPLGWLRQEKLHFFGYAGKRVCTIARCRINAGLRHQIRVHAASIGHPLAGDNLYGGSMEGDFFLEHYYLRFPGHEFRLPRALSIFAQLDKSLDGFAQ